jgi:RHS repeat-associated protein
LCTLAALLGLLALLLSALPARAEVRLPDGDYYVAMDDLSVKVMGGYVTVSRSWFRNRWHFNSAWAQLRFAYDSLDGSIKSIDRAGWGYERSGPGVFVFDARNSIRATATGYRWADRRGNTIDYDSNGRILAYADRNNVKVSFGHDVDGRLRAVFDHFGTQVLWFEWTGNDLTGVRDASRRVQYAYSAGRLTGVTDVLGHPWAYDYYGNGRLKTLTDPEGRVRQIDYAGNGRVSKVTEPDASVTQYGYDYDSARREVYVKIVHPLGRIEERWYDLRARLRRHDVNGRTQLALSSDGRSRTRSDENGASVRDELDEWDNVVRHLNADGTEQRYEYDALYTNLTRYTDERGIVTVYEYDPKGNRIRTTEALGLPEQRVTEYAYDDYGNLLSARRLADAHSADSLFEYDYDERGNLERFTDPEGHLTEYQDYNALGQARRTVDARGKVWLTQFDDAGRLVSDTDPLGHAVGYGYDKVGNLTSLTNPRGKVTRLEYDARDRLERLIDAHGNAEEQAYDAEGKLTAATDRDRRTQRFEYDALGRLQRQIDAKGHVTAMEYTDPGGVEPAAFGPTRIVYPTFENQLRYDKRNRLVLDTEVDGEAGLVTRYRYDARGQVDAVTDPAGHTLFYAYDALGRLTQVTDRLGYTLDHTYDNRDNLIAVSDQEGKVHRLVYDRANRLREERRPAGETTVYGYDPTDNLTEVQQANGHRIVYIYDDAGRLTQAEHFAADTVLAESVTTYAYDEADNLTGWSEGGFSASMVYDDLDRQTSETIDYGAFSLTYGYGYTASDLTASLTYPDSSLVTYAFDANNQLQSAEIAGEGTITVNTTRWLAPTRITLPGGSVQEYGYDGRLQLTSLKVTSPAQQVIAELNNRYGPLQELTEQTLDGGRTEYRYDEEIRLREVIRPAGTEGYTLDGVANRTGQSSQPGPWDYDDNHRLLERGDTTYAYDANGNLREKNAAGAITRYGYDVRNRLIRVEDATGNLIARYGYDPFDRRLWKEANGSLTYYLYAEEGLLGEYAADGSPLVSYGYTPGSPTSTDVLFVRAGSQTFYTHNDQLGTTLRISDRLGNLVWSAAYDAFGQAQVSPASTLSFNPRLPGQYFDAETGLHYNHRRYYDPQIGRYLTEDPIGLEGGVNLYAYVEGDPLNAVDPTGEVAPAVAWGARVAWGFAKEWAQCFALCLGVASAANYFFGDCPIPPELAAGCAAGCAVPPFLRPPCRWGRNSFTGDTLVHTESGLKPIKDIEVGENVLAWAEWKDEYAYKPVTQIFTGEKEYELARITLDNGEVIEATPEHPLYVSGAGWRAAQLVEPGDHLLRAGEDEAAVRQVSRYRHREVVFNLAIEDYATFLVGSDAVLAHNAKSSTSGNNSAAAKGRQKHQTYRYPGEANKRQNREVRVPSGVVDAIDPKKKIAYELKPKNNRAIQRGLQQLKRYLPDLAKRFGGKWKGCIKTYR